MTTHPQQIDYILAEGRKYKTVDRDEVEQILKDVDFEEIMTNEPTMAIFRGLGNFRTTVWGGPQRRTCYFFIDQRRLLWIADPVTRSIEIPRYSYQIDLVSSL